MVNAHIDMGDGLYRVGDTTVNPWNRAIGDELNNGTRQSMVNA